MIDGFRKKLTQVDDATYRPMIRLRYRTKAAIVILRRPIRFIFTVNVRSPAELFHWPV